VALHAVRLACELPDVLGRSLGQWDCTELARQLIREAVVETISPQTVQRLLARRRLKPWRVHSWLHPKAPRDAEFVRRTRDVADLLTCELGPAEMALSLDELTSLQPRPRTAPTRAARPGEPVRVEHEYARKGALHLFAAFDTRTGRVYGECFYRKRQVELITFLERLEAAIPPAIGAIHLLWDNVSVHHGRKVRRWLARHPRFVPHFTPVHCSWMNPVEQWLSILRRKRLRAPNFADVPALARAVRQFITEWNQIAHPFRWTARSFEKILAKAEAALPPADDRLAEAA
jgi:transposase